VFNLVWEGLALNLGTFREIAPVLRAMRERHRIALHLVTDLECPRGSMHYLKRPTKPLARSILGMDDFYLYEWNAALLPTICTACDLAVIPIPMSAPFLRGKPENKLVLFWRMGLPVVTSATPAYERAMAGAGLSMTCRTPEDWVAALTRLLDDESARRDAGQRGRAHANAAYGEERIVRQWDDALASVLGG
jgi:glycosyltransferase involved in cell wall biosynthesis